MWTRGMESRGRQTREAGDCSVSALCDSLSHAGRERKEPCDVNVGRTNTGTGTLQERAAEIHWD